MTSLQDYLKKYTSDTTKTETEKKKGKKKKNKERSKLSKLTPSGIRVIDDDVKWQKDIAEASDEEDPEIAPVVETDLEVQRMLRLEKARQARPFLQLGEDGSGWVEVSMGSEASKINKTHGEAPLSGKENISRSPNLSPPRRGRGGSPDLSPPRKIRHDSPDISPPRKTKETSPDLSPPRKKRHDSPESPSPRRKPENFSPDISPPRRKRHDSSDISPPRKGRQDSPDLSPVRKLKKPLSPQKKQFSRDISPPRRRRHDSPDLSPPRKSKAHSPDISPPRVRKSSPNRGRISRDFSPPRRRRHDSVSPDISPPRRGRRDSDLSPPRKAQESVQKNRKREREESFKEKKEERMSDGTLAGLRTGKEITAEMDEKRRADAARFAALSAEVSGRGAKTVYRDKQGKKTNLEAIMEQGRLDAEAKKKKELPPAVWQKGLAQQKQALEEAKALEEAANARIGNTDIDASRDNELKSAIRWGDPMAHLVKAKKPEFQFTDYSSNPLFQASGFKIPQEVPEHSWIRRKVSAPPNRYGIRPGRHWDGVDRSTGFEKNYFKAINERSERQKEAYMWSVEDIETEPSTSMEFSRLQITEMGVKFKRLLLVRLRVDRRSW